MPELPEVQTIVSDLNKKITGRRIRRIWFDAPKLIKKPKPGEFEKQIKGLKITEVKRRGKNILIYLTKNLKSKTKSYLLLIHQKMTGHLLYGKWRVKKVSSSKSQVSSLLRGPLREKVNNYIHLVFYFDNGWQMALSDLRKFAKVVFGLKEEIEDLPELKKIGPDAISKNFTFQKFKGTLNNSRGKIKQVLMNQEVIAGIGNIYSDDILWQAKIHPFRTADSLKPKELKSTYSAMRGILAKAVRLRGTSISDYRDPDGKSGFYADKRLVYRRERELCRRCQNPIKRVKIGGRSAHYCPNCQKQF